MKVFEALGEIFDAFQPFTLSAAFAAEKSPVEEERMTDYLHWCEVAMHLIGYLLLLYLTLEKEHRKYLNAYVCLVIAAMSAFALACAN